MKKKPLALKNQTGSQFIIYKTEDGQTKIDVRFDGETVWLTQQAMAELFQTSKQIVSHHIINVLKEQELQADRTVKKYLTVQNEGQREVSREIEYYNLDMIISVGYRIKSKIATAFRQWATKHLKEFIIKGFVLDDERLKNPDLPYDYFEELTKRIQDIRTSEKRFYKKITDIYALSVDYDPTDEQSIKFFKTVQNKLHWAITGEHGASITVREPDGQLRDLRLQDGFDVNSKPNTKCNIFNDAFATIFEHLATRYGMEEILGKYALVSTSSYYPQDIARYKGHGRKTPHGYLVLASIQPEGNLRLSAIDPYHSEKKYQYLDKTRYRQVDTLLGLYESFGSSIKPILHWDKNELALVDNLLGVLNPEANIEPSSLVPFLANILTMLENTKEATFDSDLSRRILGIKGKTIIDTLKAIEKFGSLWIEAVGEGAIVQEQKDYLLSKQKYYEAENEVEFINACLDRAKAVISIAIDQVLDKSVTQLEEDRSPVLKSRTLSLINIVSSLDDLANYGIDIDSYAWERMVDYLSDLSHEVTGVDTFGEWDEDDKDITELVYRGTWDEIFNINYDRGSEQYEHYVEFKGSFYTLLLRIGTEKWLDRIKKDFQENGSLSEIKRDILQNVVESLKRDGVYQEYVQDFETFKLD